VLQILSTPFAFAHDAPTMPAFVPRLDLCAGIAGESETYRNRNSIMLIVTAHKAAPSQHTI
jgi:hypothetical protein